MFATWLIYFIFCVLLIYHAMSRNSRRNRLYSKIPGPKTYPFIGNALMFMKSNRWELWCEIHQLVRKYYPISLYWIFNKAIVIVQHPDDLEILLSSKKTIEKGSVYHYLEPWLETGLLTSRDEKWRHRRRILTPAFHISITKKYIHIVTEQAKKMVESLKEEGSESVKNLIPFFSNFTLNIIGESTMGVALDKLDPRVFNEYSQSVHDMGEVFEYRLFRPHLVNCIFPYVPKMGPMQTKAVKIFHGFTNKVIQERRKYHKSEGNKFLNEYNNSSEGLIYDDTEIGTKKRLAMLDLLLAAEKKGLIDNAGIKEEVDTFVLAGHDSTSHAITYTLLLLAENKDAQDQAREEVTKIMDTANGKAGVAEIQQFQYLERCIKESLRLFPPVPTFMRKIREDLQLKHALIPAYTDIVICIWEAHRDPNFWPEPDKFDPDRFLPENSWVRHPYSYIPFSAGPRNCIGQKFAMMELKSMLGHLLYNFYLEPIDRTADLKLVTDLLARPLNPVHAKFVKINK